MAYCMWNLRIHLARYEAILIARVCILFWILIWIYKIWKTMQQCWEGMHDVSELKQWMIDMHNGLQQTMVKLIGVNGANVCEPVFVPEIDVFITCFNFRTIYQVGGLLWVVTNTSVSFWQWQSRLLHKLHGVCHQIIFPTFLHYLHSVLHILQKN